MEILVEGDLAGWAVASLRHCWGKGGLGGGGVDEWGRGMKGKAEQGMWGKAFAARVYVPQGIERCGGMDSVERRTYTAFRFLHIINSSFFVTFGLFVASFK